MSIQDLLKKDLMILDLKASEKMAAIDEMVASLVNHHIVTDRKVFTDAIKKREAQTSTGLGEGIAMPHAKSSSVKTPAVVFAKSHQGVDYEALDGQPTYLFFMIAATEGANDLHLQTLASLSKLLMRPGFTERLQQAQTPDEVLAVVSQEQAAYDADQEATSQPSPSSNSPQELSQAKSPAEEIYLLAVTACPTGIAHTFMAEEKLNQAAKEAGYAIKVETNGQGGIGNPLTAQDIDRATAIIVAADKQVEMARFNGKPVIITKVSHGINKASELVEQAARGQAPIYHGQVADQTASQEAIGKESLGRQFYKHLMNGVSHMLPFVVAGGILIALSFFWGINAADPADPTYSPIAQTLMILGKLSFAMMLPILSGYIGQSLADRPGLVIGLMGGIFANPGVLADFGGGVGLFENTIPSGFLGALIAGFLAGGIVYGLRKAFAWLPKSLEGLKPIFLFPVFGVLVMGLLMLFVVNGPMGAVMNGLISAIDSIPEEWGLVLGFVVAAMMSIDMGGPINKAAYVTGTALVASSNGAGSNVMAAVMIGGMVPPLAIALSAFMNKNLWPEAQRNSAYVNIAMGAAFITEGAIPFAASAPLQVIPPLAFAAGVSGAMSMGFDIVSKVPHGGLFAVLAGGVTNPLMYVLSWLVGGVIGGVLLNVTLRRKKNLTK